MVTLAFPAESLEVCVPDLAEDREQSLERFIQLNPDLRVEQEADGTLTVMAPAGGESGASNGEVAGQLYVWARQDGTGVAFDASTGFRLPVSGAIRAPDAAWLRRERWSALSRAQRRRFPPLCPDFVLELRSETDRLDTLERKMREYQQNGARLGLLLDPVTRRVWVYGEGDARPVVLEDPASVSCDPVLPGFALDVHAVWRAGEVADP
jgi:Uma2 family endonuclease